MRIFLAVLSGALVVAYPFLVYFGLTRWSVRGIGLLLLAIVLPPYIIRVFRRGRQHLKAVLPLPIGIALLLIAAVVVDDPRFVLALPVLINLFLLLAFAATLRGPVTMIERFARMQVDDLSAEEVRYCRAVTMAWCALFLLNGGVTALLALYGPLEWWTAYAGGISYGLVGLLFTVEYVHRKARFRRFGEGFGDRVFARLFPPRTDR
jgi:uncharacterized membrane protein